MALNPSVLVFCSNMLNQTTNPGSVSPEPWSGYYPVNGSLYYYTAYVVHFHLMSNL